MEGEQKIALQIEMQAALPENRGVVFRTFLDRDCSLAEVNAVMDKLRMAVDRQNAFVEVEKEENALLHAERLALMHARNMETVEENHQRKWVESNRRGELRLTASEQGEQKQAHNNLQMAKDDLEMHKKKLEYYRQRLNGHAG